MFIVRFGSVFLYGHIGHISIQAHIIASVIKILCLVCLILLWMPIKTEVEISFDTETKEEE